MIASRIAWAAEVAHDINSRLALIRHYSVIIGRVPSLSFAQLHQLADDHGAALVRQLNDRTDLNALAQALIGDCVTAIDECVDRLHITTEGFEGSLPNRNRAVDQSQHVQIDHWLQQAALQLPRAAGVSLQLAPGAPDAIVQAHPYVLYQVLLHLVRNAYEAIEVGSGSSVVLATRRHAEHVELVISDDGLGVPAELVPHLFEDAFSQKNQYGGMGLLIVRTLVDGMGSSIRYEQSGRGATFILTLRMSVVQTNQGGAD
jgi:two-component system CheB/CheR fusion protein